MVRFGICQVRRCWGQLVAPEVQAQAQGWGLCVPISETLRTGSGCRNIPSVPARDEEGCTWCGRRLSSRC